jgi:hypothetical protein
MGSAETLCREPVRIRTAYKPAHETTELSEDAAAKKAVVEKLDTHGLLRSGKVVVDRDKRMLVPPRNVASFEGQYYSIAKTPPKVEFGVIPSTPQFFPEPVDDHHRAMWASWGQSAYYPPNDTFHTAIGDNGSYNAHLYLVEYDPGTMTLSLSPEVNEVLGRSDEVFSEGKIHGSLDFLDGPELWFCTYWSKYPEVHEEDFATGYRGGHILSYNVETGEFIDYGVPMPRASWPASRVDTKRRILYATGYYNEFLAYDIDCREVLWAGHQPEGIVWSNRVYLIDEETGKVYTSNAHPSDSEANLIEYDPAKNRFTLLDAPMPALEKIGNSTAEEKRSTMRACTYHRGPDNLFFGCTHAGELFSFDPSTHKIEDRGINWPGEQRYTTSLERSPGGRYLYYLPGAHGHGSYEGSPLMQYDIQTGQRKVLAFLAPYCIEKYGYTPSGAFSLKLDRKGERVFICWNGGFYEYEGEDYVKEGSLFDHNAVMLVHIPEGEREE